MASSFYFSVIRDSHAAVACCESDIVRPSCDLPFRQLDPSLGSFTELRVTPLSSSLPVSHITRPISSSEVSHQELIYLDLDFMMLSLISGERKPGATPLPSSSYSVICRLSQGLSVWRIGSGLHSEIWGPFAHQGSSVRSEAFGIRFEQIYMMSCVNFVLPPKMSVLYSSGLTRLKT